MAANKITVTIYEASPGEYKAYPPLVKLNFADVNGPEVLVLKNKTNDDLVVFVEAGAFDPAKAVAKPLVSKDKVNFPSVTQGAGESNLYNYHVLVAKTGQKAKGNSDPVVIIEN